MVYWRAKLLYAKLSCVCTVTSTASSAVCTGNKAYVASNDFFLQRSLKFRGGVCLRLYCVCNITGAVRDGEIDVDGRTVGEIILGAVMRICFFNASARCVFDSRVLHLTLCNEALYNMLRMVGEY